MPDIAMCMNENCPKSRTCYRFLATPDSRQTYIQPEFTKAGCDLYWEINPSKSEVKRLDTVNSLFGSDDEEA